MKCFKKVPADFLFLSFRICNNLVTYTKNKTRKSTRNWFPSFFKGFSQLFKDSLHIQCWNFTDLSKTAKKFYFKHFLHKFSYSIISLNIGVPDVDVAGGSGRNNLPQF